MRKFLFCLFLLLLSSIALRAQLCSPFSSFADGVSVGLEKNRSFVLEYGKGGLGVRFQQSLTFDRARHQYLRIESGYTLNIKALDISCDLFYSSNWKFDKYNIGSQISIYSRFFDRYGNIAVRYVPYYDKELKFNHGWSISGNLNVAKDISLVAEYGEVPDFRIAYRRLYLGTIFKIHNLSVYPILEVPLYDNEIHLSHSQLVVSMAYTFGKYLKK